MGFLVTNKNTYRVAVIIPVYNEAEQIPHTQLELNRYLGDLEPKHQFDIVYIDDGSRDRTWEVLNKLKKEGGRLSAIRLAINTGHQHALLAGLVNTDADFYISLDADLQDDYYKIPEMLNLALQGADVILGVRIDRSSDSVLKRMSANLHYKLIQLLGVKSEPHHADFRLVNRKIVDRLREYKEKDIYLRALILTLSRSIERVYYKRQPRKYGSSKYSFFRMVRLAWNGITSFSVAPLRISICIGLLACVLAVFGTLWTLWSKFVSGTAVPGWASTTLSIYFMGGVQLFTIGILGEYVGKIYKEVKGQPNYFIDDEI